MSEQGRNSSYWPSLLDRALVYGGLLLILVQATWMAASTELTPMPIARLQVIVIVLGLGLNQLGLWRTASRVLARRKYFALRAEVREFHSLVRGLNQAALTEDLAGVEKMREQMIEAVDQMVLVAKFAGRPGPKLGGP